MHRQVRERFAGVWFSFLDPLQTSQWLALRCHAKSQDSPETLTSLIFFKSRKNLTHTVLKRCIGLQQFQTHLQFGSHKAERDGTIEVHKQSVLVDYRLIIHFL